MPKPLLQIEDLQVDFNTELGSDTAIKNISFEVDRGEIVAIVGESGSGKSVTALSILQLLPKHSAQFPNGKILFSENGTETIDLLGLAPDQMRAIRGNQVAMIFQEPMTSLNPVFSCGYQVMEAVQLHQNISKQEAKQRSIDLFGKVRLPHPGEIFNRYPHELSGGQKQRVMIAIAMSCNPSLLICDEPTTALDTTVQKTILQLIKELQVIERMGVIFITHDLGVVAEIADRAIVMYRGEIVEKNNVGNIFKSPVHPYTKGLLACRPVLHVKGERLPVVSDFMVLNQSGELVEKVTSHSRPSNNQKTPSTNFKSSSGDPLINVQHLKVWYPANKTFLGKPSKFIKAVDDVTFDVMEGETLGLVGESGCGKTTLGRALLRLIAITSGNILYKGIDLVELKKNELNKLRKNIQLIFQDPYSSLNPKITIGEAISEPLKVHGVRKTERGRKEKVIELLEKVKLNPEYYDRYPHEFSGGQRQRIVIARALALSPSFIVCDESISALDVSVQAQVLNLLNDLKKELGFTVIFISHDLAVVRYISDRIIVMNQGKIEEMGDAERIYNHQEKEYTKKLLLSIPGYKGQQ